MGRCKPIWANEMRRKGRRLTCGFWEGLFLILESRPWKVSLSPAGQESEAFRPAVPGDHLAAMREACVKKSQRNSQSFDPTILS